MKASLNSVKLKH